MTDTIFDDRQLLLEYYQALAGEFQWRFQSIWEAMRHYTWLLSILLAGWPVALFLSKDLTTIKASLQPFFLGMRELELFFSLALWSSESSPF